MTEKRGRKPRNEKAMSSTERSRLKREADRVAGAAAAAVATPVVPKPPRRQRSDSAAAAVRAMVNASKDYPLPLWNTPLTSSAIPFWNAIMKSRAIDDWTDSELVSAANLAQCQADFIDEDAELRNEGRVIVDYLGKTAINPRAKIVEDLTRRSMALMRTLRMGGKAAGDPRDLAGSRNLEAESRGIRAEVEDEEGLLA